MSIATLQSVLAQGQMVAPDTWDGISTRAAEKMSCKTALFSATAYAHCSKGIPDEGVLGCTDVVWAVSRLVEDNCSIPLIVDVRSGFSNNVRAMHYDLERVVKAGAAALLLDDRSYGCGSDSEELELVSCELFAKKVAVAKLVAENTDCMILARTYATDPAEAIARCKAAQAAGAQIVGAAYAHTPEDAKNFAAAVEGAKLWNDLTVVDGKPELTVEELDALGYGLVFMTFMEQAAWFGDMDFGVKNYRNGNTMYADLHDFDGLLRDKEGNLVDYHVIFSYWKKWMPMEKQFMDLSALGDKAYQFGKED